MRRLAVVLAALALPAAARAEPQLVLLPSPARALAAKPPVASTTALAEVRWPRRIAARERVLVGLDSTGRPRSIRVEQRLSVGGVGDYVLTVPAPALGVRALAGSDSEPGLRPGAILWQGFSPGNEQLGARVQLRLGTAAVLPVRVRVEREGGSYVVRISNATAVPTQIPVGAGSVAELAGILATLPSDPKRDVYAHVDGSGDRRTVRVEAPLRVEGELVAPGRRIRFSEVLGGGRPLVRSFIVRTSIAPRVRLTVRAFVPPDLLRLPPGIDGARALERAVLTLARAARAAQYDEFLANPDPRGTSEAVYVFQTAAAAAPVSRSTGGGGLGALAGALLAVCGVAAVAGLAVLWARS